MTREDELLKQIEDLKRKNGEARMAMFNILGEAKGQDWSDEPTEAMIKELRTWVDKFHYMKRLIANDGFVPYSTGERGYPFMVLDEYGRGKLLLVLPDTGSSLIQTHGTNAPEDEDFEKYPEFIEEVERKEDMSWNGRLHLIRQKDGDVIIKIHDQEGGWSALEFCTSGGKSPKTHRALCELMVAMKNDEPQGDSDE